MIMRTLSRTGTMTALLSALLLSSGCSKEQQDELKLEAELLMQYNAIAFSVEPTEHTGEVQLTVSLDGSALAEMLATNGYSMAQLKEFKFTGAAVPLREGGAHNYDALQRLAVELVLNGGAPVLVASIDPVPDGASALDLAVNEVNVAEIMRHDHIGLTLKLVTDQVVADTLHQLLDLDGKVVVQL